MRVAIFSAKTYDRDSFTAANADHGHELTFLEPRLKLETAPLAASHDAVCAFVHDSLDRPVLEALRPLGIRLVALRAAGFNNVDLDAADACGITICRVPAYSPYAVAEHAVALILALDRRIPRAYNRVRDGNFSLDGLLGFDLHGRTVGVVGTGRIGAVFARIMAGFGCRLLAYDPYRSAEVEALGATYAPLEEVLAGSDIVALHAPLTPETHHLIDSEAVSRMKPGVMLINTSRGALVDTEAVIDGLKDGIVGSLGLDVYEEEESLFFRDLSGTVIQDDVFARLLTFPNVLVTAHQAFFTQEAIGAIAETTLANISSFAKEGRPLHPVERATT